MVLEVRIVALLLDKLSEWTTRYFIMSDLHAVVPSRIGSCGL